LKFSNQIKLFMCVLNTLGLQHLDLEINIKFVRVEHLWYGNNAFHEKNIAGTTLFGRSGVTVFDISSIVIPQFYNI